MRPPGPKPGALPTELHPEKEQLVPDPRVELGTPASSGQRSTDELARHTSLQLQVLAPRSLSKVVDPRRLELLTSAMQTRRSTK